MTPVVAGGARLEGRVALITGAARGIGAACARRFVAEGATVVLTDVLDEEGRALASELGERAVYRTLDVRSETAWSAVVAGTVETLGALRVLVNSAGISRPCRIDELSLEAFDATMQVNLYGTFLGMREVVAPMRGAGGGSIVNISSMAAIRAFGGGSAYAASKWGVRGLTKVAAIDLAPFGIRVNSVHPGAIDTPMLADLARDRSARAATAAPAVGPRVGRPDEVADLLLFLASDESSYITGAEHLIDGGRSL